MIRGRPAAPRVSHSYRDPFKTPDKPRMLRRTRRTPGAETKANPASAHGAVSPGALKHLAPTASAPPSRPLLLSVSCVRGAKRSRPYTHDPCPISRRERNPFAWRRYGVGHAEGQAPARWHSVTSEASTHPPSAPLSDVPSSDAGALPFQPPGKDTKPRMHLRVWRTALLLDDRSVRVRPHSANAWESGLQAPPASPVPLAEMAPGPSGGSDPRAEVPLGRRFSW